MMKVSTGMVVALLLATCTPAEVTAVDFTWTGGNGGSNWMAAATPPWNPAPGAGDFADTNKTFLLGTATDIAKANGGTFSAQLTIGSNTKLQLSASSTASNLVLNGGYVSMFDKNNYTLSGKVSVATDSTISNQTGNSSGGAANLTIAASLVGTNSIVSSVTGYYLSSTIFQGDASGFSGNVSVTGTAITVANRNQAFGSGIITVQSNAQLQVNAFTQTNTINVLGGASLYIGGTSVTASNLFLGGTTTRATLSNQSPGTDRTLFGNIFVNSGGCLVRCAGDNTTGRETLDIRAPLSGTGPVELHTVAAPSQQANSGKISLTTNNSAFSGAITVSGSGQGVYVTHTNGLGGGAITIATNNPATDLTTPGTVKAVLALQKAGGAVDWVLTNNLSGNGTIQVEAGARKLTCAGGTVSPGTNAAAVGANSTGILTIGGDLAFTNNGPRYAGLNIDLAGSNNVAGVDYDRLAVSKSVTALGSADLMVNVAANLPAAVVNTQVFTIVTCTNNLTGAAFHAVQWPEQWRGDVVYGAGVIELRNLRIIPRATGIIVR